MNKWEIQQNSMVGKCEEIRGPVVVTGSDRKGPVFCPKPQRVGLLAGNLTMSLRWQRSQFAEINDAKAGAELLDLILMRKEDHGEEQLISREIASSPPFFCGTPPSRVSNPIVQDSQFRTNNNQSPLSILQIAPPSASSASPSMSPSSMKSGCVRMKFGIKSPTVRVEGFERLSRDCQNSSIAVVA